MQLSPQVRLPIPCFHTYSTKSNCLQKLYAKENIIRNTYIPEIIKKSQRGFHRCRYPYHFAICSTVTTFFANSMFYEGTFLSQHYCKPSVRDCRCEFPGTVCVHMLYSKQHLCEVNCCIMGCFHLAGSST